MISSRSADAAGAGLALVLSGAMVLSSEVNDAGNPWPVIAILVTAVAMYLAGRVLAPAVPLVAGVVLGSTAIVIMISPSGLSYGPYAPPLGYANANAAFYVQLTGLLAISALSVMDRAWRAFAALIIALLTVLTGLTGSLAGFVGVLAILTVLAVTVLTGRSGRGTLLASCLALVLTAHLAVTALGATYRPDDDRPSPVHQAVSSALSERRLLLWSDAVAITSEQPIAGTGPGTFPVSSPAAHLDADTRMAHSASLQVAAETGWPGAAALLGLLLWAVARPHLVDRGSGVAAVTATTLTALGVHASVDYVLAFPVVVLTAALVLGVGTGMATGATETDELLGSRSPA